MIVTLSGVTGVGKSFFKNLLIDELGFDNLIINTTRAIRKGEVNGIDKNFLTDKEFDDLKKQGKTAVNFEFLGNRYSYDVEDLQSDRNQVTEVHYSTIYEFRKSAKNIFAIYIIPENLERAKEELKKRNLNSQVEKDRLKEINEHIEEFYRNKDLQSQFDYVFVNDYNDKSKKELLNTIKKKLENENKVLI